jgi:threonine dehydratase
MLTFDNIRDAQRAIHSYVHRTPVIRSETYSKRWGTNVYLKLECLQKTGSFKPRGAFNKLLGLSPAQRESGVVGVSGGNHAQGLAYASKVLGIRSTICMPETTPSNYLDATREYGADIRLLPNIHAAFEEAAKMEKEGWTYVHPFDDAWVAAGQGTIGLELREDVPNLTHCYVSIGGGGLIAGIATALKCHPERQLSVPRIIGVETVGADAMAQAIAADRLVELPAITSIARTLGSPSASQKTFEAVKALVDELLVIPDADCVQELFYLLERCKILIEPAAACCLAAANEQAPTFRHDDHVVILLCGGNVSSSDLTKWHRQFLETGFRP